MTEQTDYTNASSATNGPDTGNFFPQDVRGLLMEQEHHAREFIRAHPVGVVLGALLFGYVTARLLRED